MPTPRAPDSFEIGSPLTTDAFRGQARRVAPDLLDTLLLVDTPDGPVGGLVVETEAYVNGVDPASHLAAGRTPRTESFFGGPGTVYVYTIHGHHALNVITAHDGYPEGVLVRALEPTHGLEAMRERRGFDDPAKLASGPGRLTEALGVTKGEFDGRPLAETRLTLYGTDLDRDVAVSGRIGVSRAADWPLRFTVAGEASPTPREGGDSEVQRTSDQASGQSPRAEAAEANPFVSRPVPTDESLDHDAVERCYDRLAEGCGDAHAL